MIPFSSLRKTRSAAQSSLTKAVKPDFDHALFIISDCLSEARCASAREESRRAAALFSAAERYAARTGYLELMNLVWAYEEISPAASGSAGGRSNSGDTSGAGNLFPPARD